jgi:hypothetical protein
MALTKTDLANIVEGILPVANGGTGATTTAGAANAILPSQTSNTGKYLTTDGTNTSWGTVTSNPGTVTSVSGTAPVSVATGTSTPVISMAAATTSVNGYLTSTDWNTFNGKQAAGSYVTVGGALGTPSSGTLTNCTFPTLNQNTTGSSGSCTGNAATASNATQAGGFTPSASSGVANRIVVADANGYIFNNYFNSTDNAITSGVSAIMSKASDNYYRSASAAAVAAFISGQSMNIAGASTSCSGNAATATNLAGAAFSTGSTGYYTIRSSGLIIQWGQATLAANTNTTTSYAITFPTASLATTSGSPIGATSGTSGWAPSGACPNNTSSARIWNTDDSSNTIWYIAIGY